MGVAPDGGWGWVIVLCSMMSHMLTIGVFLSLSVMYVHWLDEFNAGRGATSWIISVAVAVTYGIGPIPAHLASKFGYRVVVVAGGLMAGTGYILAYFASDVYGLVLAIGLVSGSGCGFCFLPATVTVAMYFDRRRSLAIGLGSAGVGIGSFVCAPVIHLLIERFGWRGALLVGGAIQLHLCVIGLLLRPLPPDNNELRVHVQSMSELRDVQDALLHVEDNNYSMQKIENLDAPEPKKLGVRSQVIGGSARHLSSANNMGRSAVFYSNNELRHRGELVDCTAPRSRNHSVNLDVLMCGSVHSLYLIDKGILQYDSNQNSIYSNKHINHSISSVGGHSRRRMNSSDKLSGSGLLPGYMQSASFIDNISNHQVVDSYNSLNPENSSLSGAFRHLALKNWHLIKNPVFLAFLVSNLLTNLSFLMPVLFMVDRARAYGIASSSAAILVSINGAGNVFGRIFFGYIADRWFTDRLIPYIMCLSVCGVATSLSCLCGDVFWLHGIFAFTFGCFIGAYTTLASVVIVDLVGVDLLGHAYGLMLLFTGVAGLVGPPIAGWIFDLTGNYTISYIVHGLFILISGLMLVPVAAMRTRQDLN